MACLLEQEISGNPEARAGEMYEGKETTGFWSLVPKANYASDDYLQHPREFVEKLFRATLSGGAFKIELVSSYVQSDLQDNSVCLLDVGPRLYIWLGINSSPQLAARAKGVAADYIKYATEGRQISMHTVNARTEPPAFKAHFDAWSVQAATDEPVPTPRRKAPLTPRSNTQTPRSSTAPPLSARTPPTPYAPLPPTPRSIFGVAQNSQPLPPQPQKLQHTTRALRPSPLKEPAKPATIETLLLSHLHQRRRMHGESFYADQLDDGENEDDRENEDEGENNSAE